MASKAVMMTDENGEKMMSNGVDHRMHYHNLHLFISSVFSKFVDKTVKNYFRLDNPFLIISGLIDLLLVKFHQDFDPLLYYLHIKYPEEMNVLVEYCIPFREDITRALIDRVYTYDTPTTILIENTSSVQRTDQVPIDPTKANLLWYFLMILELFQGAVRGIFPTSFVRNTIEALQADLNQRNS